MSSITFIVLARAIHVMAGVAWAGATFMLASVIIPMSRDADAGRFVGQVAGKMGRVLGIAALLTVLSGIYLFAVLHPSDNSVGGLVLKTGALAAILSWLAGVLVGRPTMLKIAKLGQQAATGNASPTLAEEMAALRKRAAVTARVGGALLGLSILAMAVFRYVQGLA